MTQIATVADLAIALESGPYAWPGGYPRYFITSDGAALSFKAVETERENVEESIRDRLSDGWRVVAVDTNWEDPALFCDHTGDRIESAYAEDEEDAA